LSAGTGCGCQGNSAGLASISRCAARAARRDGGSTFASSKMVVRPVRPSVRWLM
jgi:hypothetical protein